MVHIKKKKKLLKKKAKEKDEGIIREFFYILHNHWVLSWGSDGKSK